METARIYVVPGMSCDNCKNAIEGARGGVPGVMHFEVDVAAKIVAVNGPATEEVVHNAIDDAGFEVASVVG